MARWMYSPDADIEAAMRALEKKYPPLYSSGIERTVAMLEKLGNPHLKLPPVFHVAGTNGKGSTLAFLQAIFEAGNLSVHKYTSPHLVRFEERILLNGRMIEHDVFLNLIDECAAAVEGMQVSFFEFFTALPFLAFSRRPADVLLLETGLGGTFDATNVLPKTTGLITRISFDHMAVLGNTLPEIAANKAGIMRRGCPCIIAPQPDAGVMKVFEDHARELGTPLFRAGREWRVRPEENGFYYEGPVFRGRLPGPALAGAHQIDNAATAIAALEQSAFSFLLTPEILSAAMKNVVWPGRMQRLTAGPAMDLLPPGWEIWIDGAHNDSGAEILARQAQGWTGKPLHLFISMKEDKDPEAFCRPLAPYLASATVLRDDVGAPMMKAEALCDHLKKAGIENTDIAETLESAVAALVFQYKMPRRILVAGSL